MSERLDRAHAVTSSRYEREKDLHNTLLNERWETVSRFYSVTRESERYYQELLLADCFGKDVLEYGCGAGSNAYGLAERGARVVGIDISDVRIERARQNAEVSGLDISFSVMNAERLEFPNGSFDLVCGSGILHHLDLEAAFSELARTLRRDGRAVFLEPLGHNPVINLYRRLTPALRTPDEHPLVIADFDTAANYFERVEPRFFHLASLAAFPLRRLRCFTTVVRGLDGLDRALFAAAPGAGRYAWMTVVVLAAPSVAAPASREGAALSGRAGER